MLRRSEQHIPELSQFRQQACQWTSLILGTTPTHMGYWFNFMPAGAVITAHHHDDEDELLCAGKPGHAGSIFDWHQFRPARAGELNL